MKSRIIVIGAACGLASSAALALTPSEVFEKASPGVWAVRGLDAGGRPVSYGSAVAVGPGRLVTACSVLAKTRSIQVRREDLVREAKLEHADAERDLCLLSAPGVAAPAAPAAAAGQVKVGQRVYVIGVPEKLSLTLTEGMVSGVRSEDPKLPPLQTSAPLSAGLGGAGLFDEQARLVGIATLNIPGRTQALNFAMPAHWIAEVPERAREQLARLRTQPAQVAAAAPVAEGLPSAGTSWKYSYRENHLGRVERVFTVKAEEVRDFIVRESFSPEGAPASQRSFDARELHFAARALGGGNAVVDWAPYFLGETSRGALSKNSFAKYPAGPSVPWKIARAQISEGPVDVPAGTFSATRVQVAGVSPPHGAGGVDRFVYTAWYSAETKRYVMARHQTWTAAGSVVADEVLELLEFRPGSAATAQAPAQKTAAPAASESLPPVGATWKYGFRDQRLSRREQLFTVRVTGVDGWDVRESFAPANGVPVEATVNAKEARFGARNVGGYSVIELAPYLFSSELGKAAQESPTRYPSGRTWKISAPSIAEEETRVPAGSFKTLRVEVTGMSEAFGQATNDFSVPARFQYTAWYAPEVKRYVMVRHQAWSRTGAKVSDETVRLMEYSAK